MSLIFVNTSERSSFTLKSSGEVHMLLGTSAELLQSSQQSSACGLRSADVRHWLSDPGQPAELFLRPKLIRYTFQIAQLMVAQVSSTALQELQHVGPS